GNRGRVCRAPSVDHDGADRTALSRQARELQAAQAHHPRRGSATAAHRQGRQAPVACLGRTIFHRLAEVMKRMTVLLALLAAFSGASLAATQADTFDTLLVGGSI